MISTLTLALSVFQQNDIRVTQVNKSHAKNYHLYYKKNGVTRVVMVPKECEDAKKLQEEVQVLISRNPSEQERIGMNDG